ncbi:unnamed protein product, partial [Urochloa humidicola]
EGRATRGALAYGTSSSCRGSARSPGSSWRPRRCPSAVTVAGAVDPGLPYVVLARSPAWAQQMAALTKQWSGTSVLDIKEKVNNGGCVLVTV